MRIVVFLLEYRNIKHSHERDETALLGSSSAIEEKGYEKYSKFDELLVLPSIDHVRPTLHQHDDLPYQSRKRRDSRSEIQTHADGIGHVRGACFDVWLRLIRDICSEAQIELIRQVQAHAVGAIEHSLGVVHDPK